MFDYLLTFPQEVQLFWKRKMTGASVIFLLTRYITLLALIFELVDYAPIAPSVCGATSYLSFRMTKMTARYWYYRGYTEVSMSVVNVVWSQQYVNPSFFSAVRALFGYLQ